MRSVWICNYEHNEIRIENSWFKGEKLYVNDQLQDAQVNVFSTVLTGSIVDKNNEKKPIKASLGGFFTVGCRLFIDHVEVPLTKVK